MASQPHTGFAVRLAPNFRAGSTVVYLTGYAKPRFAAGCVRSFLAHFVFLPVSSIIVETSASRRIREIRD